MGGVQIKNCTAVPLKTQLCQVSVLYHDLVQPGEYFTRETGAAHFTTCVTVSEEGDTSWTDSVLPIFSAVASTLAGMVSGGAGFAGLVSGTATGGRSVLTRELANKLFLEADNSHCYLSSAGWYFGGKNKLEIRGGPRILADSRGYKYNGPPLRIVDRNNSSRHN